MYRAGRGRYQSGPTTVPRSMLTPDCQGKSHSVRLIIIAGPYEACIKSESRVCECTRKSDRHNHCRAVASLM